jgi:hypothetical protein
MQAAAPRRRVRRGQLLSRADVAPARALHAGSGAGAGAAETLAVGALTLPPVRLLGRAGARGGCLRGAVTQQGQRAWSEGAGLRPCGRSSRVPRSMQACTPMWQGTRARPDHDGSRGGARLRFDAVTPPVLGCAVFTVSARARLQRWLLVGQARPAHSCSVHVIM